MKRSVLFVMLLWAFALLLLAQTAKGATISTLLESKLPVSYPVVCPDSQQEWNNDPYGGAGVLAYTYMHGPLTHEIHLSYTTCLALSNGPSDNYFPVAAQTMYHEWVHAWSGEQNAQAEGNAECISLFFYRYALRHFWGVSPEQAQRDYLLAVKDHILLGQEYPQYAWTCTFPQPDPVP